MRTPIKVCTLLLLLAFSTNAQQKTSEFYDYTLVKVQKGIYFSQRAEPLRHTVEGNFVVIINDDDVVVVDAGGTPHSARLLIQDIKKLTKKPVTFLVNTHFHGDHTFGNQEFVKAFPGIQIVASAFTMQRMTERVKTFVPFTLNDSLFEARRKQTTGEIDRAREGNIPAKDSVIANLIRQRDHDLYTVRDTYHEIKITPPTLIVDSVLRRREMQEIQKPSRQRRRDRLRSQSNTDDLTTKGREIEVHFLGKGDTPGDAWVYLPKEKILITGDEVTHPVPFGFTATPSAWIETLERAAKLDFNIMIPGHGEIQYNKEYIWMVIAVLKEVRDQVQRGIDKDLTLEQVRGSVDVSGLKKKFTHGSGFVGYYFYWYFEHPVVERFYNEMKARRNR